MKYNVGDVITKVTCRNSYKFIIVEEKFSKRSWNYKIQCQKCGWISDWKTISHLNSKRFGCLSCRYFVVTDYNCVMNDEPWMVPFFQNIEDTRAYNKYSREELYFKCPSCGQISKNKMSVARLYITKNIKCNCTSGGSFSERFMSYILNKNKIDYIREYRPSWASILIEGKIRRCRYDFYFKIEDKQYIIEMDGCFHYMSNKYSEKSKMYTYIDSEKDRLAKEHNIEVIRIDCRSSTFDYVLRNCEESKLSDFLDFSLEKDSLAFIFNGYAVEICSLYKEGYGIKELSDKFNFTRATIRNYLDKGNEIGLVEYNRKENHKKNSQKQSMPVLVYTKEGIYVDSFPSMKECSRQSLTFSSKFIFDKEIRDVVINKRPFVKGFIFRREEI